MSPGVSNPIKILVVDDEPDLELLIRQKFRRQIRARELDFLFAGDGHEALKRLAEEQDVDMLLSDINMPRMDGLTLLGEVRSLDRLLKVVIVSAYGDIKNIRTAMNRGAFDFLTKPIDFSDLEATIKKTHDELALLRQASVLREKMMVLQRELDIANQIQLSVLPSRFPAFPDRSEFDLYATMIPAQEVGGDFYDFFLVDEHRLGFVIGDVSGKGVGAALFMAITRTMLRATALRGMSASECVSYTNHVLTPDSLPGMFVTLFYGILDVRTGLVTYANAGHNPPYHLRASGDLSTLESTQGLALCLLRDFKYTERSVQMEPGDSILLYTDGVTEASDGAGEQYEAERLEQCLANSSCTPVNLCRDVLRSVTRFSGGIDQSDDITLLTLQYKG